MASRWEYLLDSQEIDAALQEMTQAIVEGLREGFDVAFVELNEDGDVPVQDVTTYQLDDFQGSETGIEKEADLLSFAQLVLEQNVGRLQSPDTDLVWIKKDAHGNLGEMHFPLDELE